MTARECIEKGSAVCGIELGSTNIKAVVTDPAGHVLASGSFGWENSYVDGIWTYSLEEAFAGLRACYASLRENIEKQYGVTPASVGAVLPPLVSAL